MNVCFSWSLVDDRFVPVSRSTLLNHDGFSLLDCILMDDGGLSRLKTIPWLIEGVKRCTSVAGGDSESSNWDRETWGVEFDRRGATIYSLHEPGYFQTLRLDGFLEALRIWIDFLQAAPDDREMESREFSIDA